MDLREREDLLVAQHGEVTTVSNTARVLSRARNTVVQMLKDGRLDYACEGTMVDVRSIARYIMAPKDADFKAKVRRSGRKYMVV
jgi:hypothetical protein